MRHFACLLLLWVASVAWGQRHALDEPRLTAVGDTQSINDGVVTALAEDEAGLLWIGTTTGVVRHDGYQLRLFSVGEGVPAAGTAGPRSAPTGARAATRFVRTLLAAPGGVLWVGLEGEGLARLDTSSQRWTLYRPDPKRPGALAHGTVRALARDADGVLWVGTTGGGLYSLAPQSEVFQRHGTADGALPDDRVHALRVDRAGNLWVGTWRGLVRKARGASRFEPVFSTPGADGLAGRPVSMVGEGPDGRIWVGTRDGALVIVDPATGAGQWLERGSSGEDPGANGLQGPGGVASFVVASPDEVWIGRDRGLDLRDARGGELLQRLRRSHFKPWGLAGHNVVALLRDASGQVWVGSYGGGLQRHNPTSGVWVRRGEGPEDSPFAEGDVRSLHQLRNGEVWAGTPGGAVLVFDAGLRLRHQILPAAGGRGDARFAGGLVGAITQAADGTVWVGSDSGVHAFDGDRRLKARWSVGGGRTRRLLAASDGRLWAATQDGIYRLAPGQAAFERVARADGQPLSGNVNAVVQSADGTVWVGANTGLFRAAPGAAALQPVRAADGADLGSPVVLGMVVDRAGQLWVDTNAGLHRWRTPGDGLARFEAVRSPGGGAFGANLLEDGQGRIWSHQHVFDPRDGRVHELTSADGVDFGTGWFRAYTALADGRLLFGGSTGVLVVEPGQLRPWRYEPPLVVTDLRVNGERLPPARLQPALVLAPDQRSFSVEFASLDYSQPDRNRYRYRLEGFDADWIETGAELRVASYGNLTPGRYALQVQGSNRLGAWSTRTLSLAVQVRPAWWQTWWARLGVLGLVLGGVWGLVQLRTRLLRRRQAELEAKVRERTQALEALSRELQMKSAELEASSLTDPLTGLYNRRFLTQHMTADAALVARRHGEAARQRQDPPMDAAPPPSAGAGAAVAAASGGPDIVFFLVDIDHFKAVNDRHGHAAGDAVLLQVCERLKSAFREADYVVRWGGEEFLVAAREANRARATELAERARLAIASRPFTLEDGTALPLTASIGFAAYPLAPAHPGALDWTTTVDLADAALYVVKRGGRDGWFGLLQAETTSATALRELAARPMAQWRADHGVEVRGSRPFTVD